MGLKQLESYREEGDESFMETSEALEGESPDPAALSPPRQQLASRTRTCPTEKQG